MSYLENEHRVVRPFFRFHHFNYGWWVDADINEGIDRRIRQGRGGPDTIEVGADVRGHYHRPRDTAKIYPGNKITVKDKNGVSWKVLLEHYGSNRQEIRQGDPDVEGASFIGTVIEKVEQPA